MTVPALPAVAPPSASSSVVLPVSWVYLPSERGRRAHRQVPPLL
jgi:hypothetical protein